MDPYEYLLNKLNVMLELTPEFMSNSLYLKLETSKKIICDYIPIGWTHKKVFKFCRDLDSDEYYRQYNKELDFFCRQLSYFPDDLESIELVDLLLTLNGLNKET